MYDLYIANKNYSSWSLRPWVLMAAQGIAFNEKIAPLAPGAFRHFSPSGKVPCLVDGAVTVWESLAIVEYLAERHAGVWPADATARAWARSAASEMHAGFGELRQVCGMNCGIRVELNEISPALAADLARLQALWNDGLQRFGGPFLAGDSFTAVDAFFCPVAFRVQTYGLQLDAASMAYVERLLALPVMRDWYEAGLRETWRDPPHEAEAHASGRWTADLRAVASP
jgi:glutathione S-transferase